MKEYLAYIVFDNEYQPVEFETAENPIEFLWNRYGMDTMITSLEEKQSEATVFENEEITAEEGI